MNDKEADIVITQGGSNVFEDLGFDAVEAASLKICTDLALNLRRYVQSQGWTAMEAAVFFEETESRFQKLLNGEIGSFNMDKLISLLVKAGMRVKVEVLPEAA